MMRGLLGKELRQHAFTLGFLALFLVGAWLLITHHSFLRRAGGGGFEAVRFLQITFTPLACLVLGQVLIASEFRQKTQLFLEGLPLPRWRMLLVKFLLGLVVLLGSTFVTLFIAGWQARHTEAMTPQFALLLTLKAGGWAWFLYTLCFAHAFLGRYRLLFGFVVFFGFLYASELKIPVDEFGPFALIDSRFAYERLVVPEKALAVTLGLGGALTALGFYLGLMRDATVAALLAEKMTSREKVFIGLIAFVALYLMVWLSEHRKASTPVLLPGSIEAQHGVVHVIAAAAVDAPKSGETAALQTLANRTAEDLGTLADLLGCRSFPAVFIVHRRDLGGGELVNGELHREQGVMVRVNIMAKEFSEPALQRWLLRETLLAQRSGLADRERNAWVFDGLQAWWPQHRQAGAEQGDRAARNQAREVPLGDFSAHDLRAWLSLRKRLGEDRARLLAGSGLAVIETTHGPAALQKFLSSMFAGALPADARGWVRDVFRSTPARLETATGWDEEKLVEEWRAALVRPEPVPLPPQP